MKTRQSIRRAVTAADLDGSMSQRAFAALLGITPQVVTTLATSGVIRLDQTGLEWLRCYLANLREQAAGRMGKQAGGLSLADERAALSRAQRLALEHKYRVTCGEYAPIGLIDDVLGAAGAEVRDRMDHIEGDLAKRCPDLPESAKRVLLAAVADARNAWATACERGVRSFLDQNTEVVDDDEPATPPRDKGRRR